MTDLILVVEDDFANRRFIQALCRMLGLESIGFESGEQMLDYLDAHPAPALIIADLYLPGMSGLDLSHLLSSTPETADIPRVAVTACPERFSSEAIRSAGFTTLIGKPIDHNALRRVITGAVGGHAGQDLTQ